MSYLGIDIGGTKVAMRVEQKEKEHFQVTAPWPERSSVVGDLDALQRQLRSLRGRWRAPIRHVGVATPATMDSHGRVITWPNRPAWSGLDLTATLAELLPEANVRCADDGDLAALAEAFAAGESDVVYLGVGTGIGGGIVLDGRSSLGLDRGSVEIGHMVIDRGGPSCDCGRRGCLQAVASGPATLRRAAQLRGGAVASAELPSALSRRRPWAVSAVAETCDAIAAAVVSLGELLHPSAAIIGGGLAAALPGFVETISERAGRWARPGHPPPEVRPAAFGALSSLYGAVRLARDGSAAT